jgi:hypothetical protein
MTRPLTPFQLGEVISGEPHLYVSNPPITPLDSAVETDQTSYQNKPHGLRHFVAALRRRFRLRPTPEDALASALGKMFRP